MAKIIFDATILKYMSLFSSITHVQPKDCISDEHGVMFIVPTGEIARAIGGGGSNIRRIEGLIKKRIRVAEFDENMITFIEKLSYPAKIKEIRQDEETVTITALESESRGMLIGRNAANLRRMEEIVRRYFQLKEIKVK